jgi:hypothetical protein
MKRSSQVALLLAGVTAAGASAYAMMSPDDCTTLERPASVAPGGANQPQSRCSTSSRSSNSSHSYGSNHSGIWGSDVNSHSGSSSSSSTSHASLGGGGTSWGGFGSTGHSFSSYSSGG